MFNIKGLSNKEVIDNRKKYGTNEITEHKKVTLISLIIESLNDPIIKILLIALGLKIIFFINDSDIYETIGIIVAIILATIISSMSEYGSEKAFNKLSEENSKIKTKVIRNNKLNVINIDEVVMYDKIYLESGDKISADGVIIYGNISTDESMLTGETKEQYKSLNNKVYMGSVVTNGLGVMEVREVGNNTYYGKIAKDIQEHAPISPLKNRLKDLATFISKIGYICAFLVIISYLFSTIVISNNFDMDKIINFITTKELILPELLYSLTLGITIIVVAVPEGLPMMITLVLSSNMKRLLKENVLVRKLVGIEASGSLNILFTDKTGTITKGELSVVELIDYKGNKYRCLEDIRNNELRKLYNISLLYNNESNYIDNKVIGGNTTDKAILKFISNKNKDEYIISDRKEFNSKDKYSSIKVNNHIYYKGAYEVIIDKCERYYRVDSSVGLIESKKDLLSMCDKYTSLGYRVLAFCEDKTFLGIILIKDELRKESISGIKLIKDAGINTVMITGDNKLTAVNIAKEAGIISNDNDIVITSEELHRMSDIEVKNIIPRLKVVARSLPEDKKRLVLLSQELGLVVGMTGDGVNDAPALRKADVSFGMGSGTEVAKEVSDIIILDDNIKSIASAILYGRTIFKSIRKFIIFQLTVNLTACSISVIGPLIGLASPVTTIQMLWINMIMDTLAGIAYSYEPAILSYMKEKPKNKNEKIMNSYMINEILVTGSYMSILCMIFLKDNNLKHLYRVGSSNKYLMTAFFALFIFMTLFNAFNARSERLNIFSNLLKNKIFLSIILFIFLIQLIMIYFGGAIFRTTGLTFFELFITIIIASSVIPFDFIRKRILKRRGKNYGV